MRALPLLLLLSCAAHVRQGPVAQSDLLDAMVERKEELGRCVVLHRGPAHGKALLLFRVRPSGESYDVEVSGAPEALASCLREVVATVRTRPHTVELTERVVFPIKY